MKRVILIYRRVAFILLLALSYNALSAKDVQSVGYKYLEDSFQTYDKIQKKIHSLSEMGYLEYESSRLLSEHLEANGFTVERGVAGIPTAFIASYGSGDPVIGLTGEFDALPGMSQDTTTFQQAVKEGAPGHACGHNLLGTGPAAAAVAISKWLAQGHKGTIKYFGCPAEEGGGAKGYMAAAGCFKSCDCVLDWHPGSGSCVTMRTGLANLRVVFSFYGTSSHAGGAPWKGRSALDAVEAFNFMMNLMREHVTPDIRIHYIITNGGQAPNVVPNFAQCEYYFRGATGEAAKAVAERAFKAAKAAADGTETRMEYEIRNGSYEFHANEALSRILLKNFLKVGGVKLDEREKAFCTELMKNSGVKPDLSNFEKIASEIMPRVAIGGSTDVGDVSQVVPVARMYYCCFTNTSAGHSWQNCSVGGTTIGTKAIMNVARIQYLTALEIFSNPALLIPVKKEFEAFHNADYVYKQLQGDRKPPLDYCVGR